MPRYSYQVLAFVIAILFGIGLAKLLFPAGDNKAQLKILEAQIRNLSTENASLKDSIATRDNLIKELELKNLEMDGVIMKLNRDVEIANEKFEKEESRIDKLTEDELTKEILDYYSN